MGYLKVQEEMENSTIRCIAIDDEPLALSVIESFCKRRGGILLSAYSEPCKGLEAIYREKPQIVFLDMRMNSVSGLEIARNLVGTCAVVFTTAYADFALDGFELDAADFLHKPFSYERFCHAVEKAMQHLPALLDGQSDTILVRQEYKEVPVHTGEIIYIQAMGNYIRIFLSGDRCVISRTSLKNISDSLPQGMFIQTHRSYIVPVASVTSFSQSRLTISGNGKEISLPVGRAYRESLLKAVGHYTG